MHVIPIIRKSVNLEIFTKIVNSVASKYECHVDYLADENRLVFHGDIDCCKHITEEALSLFSNDENAALPLALPIDQAQVDQE